MKLEIRKLLLCSLLGAICYMLVGWLVFEYFLGAYMASNTLQLEGFHKNESGSGYLFLFISCFAYSSLLTLIFGNWAKINSFKDGLKAGALIGVLVAVMANTYWYSTTNYFNTIFPLLVDVGAAAVTVGLMGGCIGWYVGRK